MWCFLDILGAVCPVISTSTIRKFQLWLVDRVYHTPLRRLEGRKAKERVDTVSKGCDAWVSPEVSVAEKAIGVNMAVVSGIQFGFIRSHTHRPGWIQ